MFMIQRIQTIFLSMTVASFGALYKFPLATSDMPSAQFLADRVFDIKDHPALLILTGIGAVIALISIFLFRNRKLQLKLGYLIIVIAILLPIVAFLLFKNESTMMDSSVQVHGQPGVLLPLVAVLFATLSNYYIRKDDKLVKSMDRLR